MITLVLIAHNQERLLKEHLSGYQTALSQVNGSIILIDDASSDQTKDYVTTHFKSIRYMKNQKELGYISSFNNALSYIKTPLTLCIDLTIETHYLPLKNILNLANNPSFFMMSFSITDNQKKVLGYTLNYHRFSFKWTLATSKKEPYYCSEIMLFNTQKLHHFYGLNEDYFSPEFSWMDLMYRASQETVLFKHEKTAVCYKRTRSRCFFSYPSNPKSLFKDNFLYQWNHYTSAPFKLRRVIHILLIFLTFNGSRSYHFLDALFHKLFFSKQSYKTFNPSPTNQSPPILLSHRSHWKPDIIIHDFSFKKLFKTQSSPIFIDSQSVSLPNYYLLKAISFISKKCLNKNLFSFVSSDYSLEHELALISA